jgi:hypothetical protein
MPTNNFDGFMDADVSDRLSQMLWNFSAHVDKDIITIVSMIGHCAAKIESNPRPVEFLSGNTKQSYCLYKSSDYA